MTMQIFSGNAAAFTCGAGAKVNAAVMSSAMYFFIKWKEGGAGRGCRRHSQPSPNTNLVRALQKLDDEAGVASGDVSANTHVVDDGVPLRVAERFGRAHIVAASAAFCPKLGSVGAVIVRCNGAFTGCGGACECSADGEDGSGDGSDGGADFERCDHDRFVAVGVELESCGELEQECVGVGFAVVPVVYFVCGFQDGCAGNPVVHTERESLLIKAAGGIVGSF